MDTVHSLIEFVASKLEEFVREAGSVADMDSEFNRQVHLFRTGYLDSLGVESLIVFIESEFGIELSDESLNTSDFSSIDGISAIVSGEIQAKGGARGRA